MALERKCWTCTKTGIEAVNCDTFIKYDLEELQKFGKNCASPEDSASTNNIAGAGFVPSLRKSKPKPNSAIPFASRNMSPKPWRSMRETKDT